MANNNISESKLEQSYKEAERLRRGDMPDWMFKRAELESQGIDFGDGMSCGITPPVTRIKNG